MDGFKVFDFLDKRIIPPCYLVISMGNIALAFIKFYEGSLYGVGNLILGITFAIIYHYQSIGRYIK